MNSYIDNLKIDLDDLDGKIDEILQQSVKKAMDQVRYDIQTNRLGGTKVDMDAIQSVLQQKIDKDELLTLLDLKSNSDDTRNALKSIDVLHSQNKHLIVILWELLRQRVTKFTEKNENSSAKEAEANAIFNAANQIAKWINKFDPKHRIEEDYPETILPPNVIDKSIEFTKFENVKLKFPDLNKISHQTLNPDFVKVNEIS